MKEHEVVLLAPPPIVLSDPALLDWLLKQTHVTKSSTRAAGMTLCTTAAGVELWVSDRAWRQG